MKVDARITGHLADASSAAARFEASGYSGAWAAETIGDPFLMTLMAATSTDSMQVGTSVAVAFARNPMTVAMAANDLQRLSRGRFVLGLGTQVKAHIERRYSMPWSAPAARMREYVAALHAIWNAWNEGEKLSFRGDYYRHDLMSPFFAPEPNPYGSPLVFLAGVGPKMTEVAGAVADGFVCHAFTTEKFLRDVTLPLLTRARQAAGKEMIDFQISGLSFVVTGRDDDEIAAAARTRQQIAFYASTPAYRSVLEVHGWGDLQTELNNLVRQERWSEMSGLISDEMLGTFAIVEPPERIAGALNARFGDLVQRIGLYTLHDPDAAVWEPVVREISNQL